MRLSKWFLLVMAAAMTTIFASSGFSQPTGSVYTVRYTVPYVVYSDKECDASHGAVDCVTVKCPQFQIPCVELTDCEVVIHCDGECDPTATPCEFALRAKVKQGGGAGNCDECDADCDPSELKSFIVEPHSDDTSDISNCGSHSTSGMNCMASRNETPKEFKVTLTLPCSEDSQSSGTATLKMYVQCGGNCVTPGTKVTTLGSVSVTFICGVCKQGLE